MHCPSIREFHRSFKPLLCFLETLGLLATEIREFNGKLVTVRSTFGTIQTAAWIIIYSGIFYFMKKNEIIVMKIAGISLLIENIQLLAFELIFYIVVVSAIIKQREFLRIIKSISELDLLLFQLGEEIDYKKQFRRNIILVVSVCTMTGSMVITAIVREYQPGFEYVFHTLLWLPPVFLTHMTLLQFSVMVYSLKLRCSKLNTILLKIISFANKQNFDVIPNIEIDDENLRVRHWNYNIESTIWDLSVVYDMICDICKTINKVFAFQTTFELGVLSIIVTFRIYAIATIINDPTYPYKWKELTHKIYPLVLNTSAIFGVIHCCSEAKNEADQVAILLHKIKPKRIEHREAINNFSLQSMHQKVQFTACGLFNLDYTFIYLLISTISTYIVILVQFGQASSS